MVSCFNPLKCIHPPSKPKRTVLDFYSLDLRNKGLSRTHWGTHYLCLSGQEGQEGSTEGVSTLRRVVSVLDWKDPSSPPWTPSRCSWVCARARDVSPPPPSVRPDPVSYSTSHRRTWSVRTPKPSFLNAKGRCLNI